MNVNKKDKIKLSAISNIDDKYIDESTKTRIKLYAKLKKKKRSRVGVIVAFAAAIAIIMSLALAVMLPMLLGGNEKVRIYRAAWRRAHSEQYRRGAEIRRRTHSKRR